MGTYVLYSTDRQNKKCRVGLVLTVARTENCIVVHRMEPVQNHQLRVKWLKVYIGSEGKETLEPVSLDQLERRREPV